MDILPGAEERVIGVDLSFSSACAGQDRATVRQSSWPFLQFGKIQLDLLMELESTHTKIAVPAKYMELIILLRILSCQCMDNLIGSASNKNDGVGRAGATV